MPIALLGLVCMRGSSSPAATAAASTNHAPLCGFFSLRRQFSGLQNFGFTLTNSSVLIGIVPLFGFGMLTGGPVVAIWGWLLVAFFVMFIGLGMAEICSTFPTAGGLYFWTAKL